MPLTLATSAVKFNRKEIQILLFCFVITCFIASAICITNAVLMTNRPMMLGNYFNSADYTVLHPSASNEWLSFSYMGLARGIGMHPAYMSMYLAFCIVFLLTDFHINPRHRYISIIRVTLIIYFSIFIVFLASRIIIFSLITVYVTTIIICFSACDTRKYAVLIFSLLLLCLLTLYVNPVSRYKNLQEILKFSFVKSDNSTARTATQIRASLLWVSWGAFKQINPAIGAGTGDVKEVMFKTSKELKITNAHNTYDPHNQYFSMVLAVGLFGLIVFIASLAIPAVLAFGYRDYLLMGFIFLFASLCFSETVLERQKGVAFFALFFPLLAFHRQSFQNFPITLKMLRARS
jgi:hypothetical protein